MSLLRKIRTFQLTTAGIRICGMIFLALGTYGAMLQTKALGVGAMTNTQLLDLLEQNPDVMSAVTMALVMQIFGACAIPVFMFLLVEGVTHTASFGKYFLRVLGLAVVCQLPYNMVMTGSVLYMLHLNPVFATVMCMVMLYFFRTYPGKTGKNVLLKVVAFVGVYLWTNMLGIEHGACCVILCAVLWLLRGKNNMQTFIGIAVMFACSIFSMFYMAGVLSFLALHFYEGDKGAENRWMNYLTYPVILLACGLMMVFM